eukprot:5703931-Pyramimonas_sp.AAC.1
MDRSTGLTAAFRQRRSSDVGRSRASGGGPADTAHDWTVGARTARPGCSPGWLRRPILSGL